MLTAAASNRRSIEFCTRPSQLLGWLRTKSWPSHHRVLQDSLLGNSAARSYVLFAKRQVLEQIGVEDSRRTRTSCLRSGKPRGAGLQMYAEKLSRRRPPMIQNRKSCAIEPISKPIVQPFKQLQYAGGLPGRSSPWSWHVQEHRPPRTLLSEMPKRTDWSVSR